VHAFWSVSSLYLALGLTKVKQNTNQLFENQALPFFSRPYLEPE